MDTGAPASQVDDKPTVTLLAVPAYKPESVSFASLPEPVLSDIDGVSPAEPQVLQRVFVDSFQKTDAPLIGKARLPEPALPEKDSTKTLPRIVTPSPRLTGAHDETEKPGPVADLRVDTRGAAAAVGPGGPQPAEPKPLPTAPAAQRTEVPRATPEPSIAVEQANIEEPGSRADGPVDTKVSTVAAQRAAVRVLPDGPQPAGAIQYPSSQSESRNIDTSAIREVAVLASDTLQLSFEGRGWIYTAADTSEDEVSLISRTITMDKTLFEFYTAAAGEYVLEFQYQDNRTGIREVEQVALSVFEEMDLRPETMAAEIAAIPSVEQTSDRPPEDLSQALENPQAAAAALPQILSGVRSGDREKLDRIALLYKNAGHIVEYTMCLEKYLEVFPNSHANDLRYFELGRLYETAELRNEKKARQYYAAILKLYPASLYYLDAAARVRYFDRHFFELR